MKAALIKVTRPATLTLTFRVTGLLALAGLSFGGALAGLIESAHRFGKEGKIAVMIALSVDLLAAIAAVELAERHRARLRRWDAFAVLFVCVVVTISGQLVSAQRSVGGWITAAWPALAFLFVVALIEARPRPAVEPGPSLPPSRRAVRRDASPEGTGAVLPAAQPEVRVSGRRAPGEAPAAILAALAADRSNGNHGLSAAELERTTGLPKSTVASALRALGSQEQVIKEADRHRLVAGHV